MQSVAVVRRGTCTFVQKALNAQKAGAKGVIIVNDDDLLQIMGTGNSSHDSLQVDIFVVGVSKSLGDKILGYDADNPEQTVIMSFDVYAPTVWNLSELLLISFATFLVVAGAFFATADLRAGSPIAPPREEVLEVGNDTALGFCVLGSCCLLVLFFFMHYMIYVIIGAFCLGGGSCITQILSMFLQHHFPDLKRRAVDIPFFGPASIGDLIAAPIAIAVVACWFVLRNHETGWIFQDIIGAGFLCWMQRTLRLPDIKVATVLLSMMFCFDVFWVFISPLIFKESVMVGVATGRGTGEAVPMLLRVPSFGDPFGRDRMLGFGDVALPGLLISYLRRHDVKGKRTPFDGYFVPAVIGYFCGLCVTICALAIMRMGQPALLYLVPGTLGTTLVLASVRGEFWALWKGKARRSNAVASAAEDCAGSNGLTAPSGESQDLMAETNGQP